MKLQLSFPIKPCHDIQSFGLNYVNYQQLLGLKGHPGQDLVSLDGDIANWPYNTSGANISYGKTIHSSCDGVVSSLENDTNGGFTVVVATEPFDYLDKQVPYKIIYAHCIPGSFRVKVGDKVKLGDPLALCGDSGVIPGEPDSHPDKAHVHFGVKPAELMPAVGEEPAWYRNIEQDNGYGGAIDPATFWSGKFAEDVLVPDIPPQEAQQIQVQVNWLIQLIQNLWKVIKGRKL